MELATTVLVPGVQKNIKKPFGANSFFFFANNYLTKKASGIIRAPSCSSRQGVSKHIDGDLERSGHNLTSGQGHVRSHVDLMLTRSHVDMLT